MTFPELRLNPTWGIGAPAPPFLDGSQDVPCLRGRFEGSTCSVLRGVWYLAHPVRAETAEGIRYNAAHATWWAAELFTRGVRVFSAATHSVAIYEMILDDIGVIDVGSEAWFALDFGIFRECAGLLLPPDLKESKGCWREIGWAEGLDKPIAELVLPGGAPP